MNKLIAALLLSITLALPVSADHVPDAQIQKDLAILSMSQTPLVMMDKESALLVAATSYECASYYIGMTVVAKAMEEAEQLNGAVDPEKFTRLSNRVAGYHIGLAEIIHMIHDITEEQDLAIMMEQNAKVKVVLTEFTPNEIDVRYGVQCAAILRTYLPTLFKEEEKNGA